MFFKDYRGRRRGVKIFSSLLAVLIAVVLLSAGPKPAQAQITASVLASIPETVTNLLDKLKDNIGKILKKTGSSLLQNMVRKGVNQLAYDTATHIGSAASGQKPLFEQESWDTILKNTSGRAFGDAIDSLSESWDINLCEPSLSAKINIGLGAKKQAAPGKPNCDWQTFTANWDAEKLKDDFLKNSSVTFEPTNNELGQAFYILAKNFDKAEEKELTKKAELISKQGWLDLRNIGGVADAYPGKSEVEIDKSTQAYWESIQKVTGDIFVDAANVFLNQLALSTYQGVMDKLAKKDGAGSLSSAESDPNTSGGGTAAIRSTLGKLVESSFDSRGDYDILGELSVCDSSFGVGPTNCVINEGFRDAIASKKTVGQAMKEGLLKKDAPFGFKTSGIGAIEPSYMEGFPYRSMLILRKFRILPIGWELAAQKIHSDSLARKNAYLGKLVECYSKDDKYEGYWADWCDGLIDPDWVLKAPQNYCAKEGYGPQILFQQAVNQGVESVTLSEDENGDGTLDSAEDINGNGVIDDKKPITVPLPSKLIVNRSDSYCADEQSCIKEKNDGSCEYYGYCTEERRKWSFGQNACEPINNSCETFKGAGGATVSYLKNTLNFCGESDYGCNKYAQSSADSYVAESKKNDWSKNGGFSYFNKNAQTCEAEDEGCHEFLRIKSGIGTNLIRNSGFENNEVSGNFNNGNGYLGLPVMQPGRPFPSDPYELESFWMIKGDGALDSSAAEITDNAPDRGGKVLHIKNSNSPVAFYSFDRSSSNNKSIFPKGFVMEPEVSYTFSADIYIKTASKVALQIGRDGQYFADEPVLSVGSWDSVSVTIKNNKDILADQIKIIAYGDGGGLVDFYIDNVKFEIGNQATPYNEYRQKNLVYQKYLPIYLEKICYKDTTRGDYSLKTDAPAECRQYVRQCNRDEANCEMFTAALGGSKLPAAVSDKDYCLAECNGFDAYVQTENNFSSRYAYYFIPKTASACSAAEAGCEEFTNLDKSAQGGETREYYSYLRQCVKPNSPGNTCASFYTWEGNDESGEQLSLHSLKAAVSGDVYLVASDASECSEIIFNYPPNDPRYNPDCRRFINQNGVVSYHSYSKTVSCTDDCHPYRMTYKNPTSFNSAQCSAAITIGVPAHWDSAANLCYVCANGGYWSNEHNACMYNAAPAESISCSASANGCAEFNGNQGNNIKKIFTSSFEAPDSDGWENINGSSLPNIPAVAVSGKYSLLITSNISGIARDVGYSAVSGGSYVLSFLAKPVGSSPIQIGAKFSNGTAAEDVLFKTVGESGLSIVPEANEWNFYQLNLASLDHKIANSEQLIITISGGQVYLDNISLSLITNRYYLLRNSWNTPSSCNQDENGKPYPLYMLGCAQYKDRLNNTHYLHRFSRLCQESAVGCEAMIDTRNSTSQSDWSGLYALDDSDSLSYVVYDPEKKCQSPNKGCERFGLAKGYEDQQTYSDVFLKNDPDKYDSIVCSAAGVGCEKWTSAAGDYYFKDPGDMVCEWRIGKVKGKNNPQMAWFKKKVKRCGATGNICSSDSDCSAVKCVLETTDDEMLACPVSSLKTFGQGGSGNEIYQPISEAGYNWVGLCSAAASGCTEYVDPVSDFSANAVYNGDFKLGEASKIANGWVKEGQKYYQNIYLEGNSLYVLLLEGNTNTSLSFIEPNQTALITPFYVLRSDNTLGAPTNSLTLSSSNSSLLFYVDKTTKAKILVDKAEVNINSKVSIRKAVIDYQLSGKVDKNSCNGVANQGEGCVYFNERSTVGNSGLKSLNVNAWSKYGSAIGGGNNANELIKVAPDRVCNQWLSCKTYVKGEDDEPVCFDIAECDRLDAGGNCVNFVTFNPDKQDNRVYAPLTPGAENKETIKNVSGYAKIGYDDTFPRLNAKTYIPSSQLSFGLMKQTGEKVDVPNGGFESSIKNLNKKQDAFIYNPAGWSPYKSYWNKDDVDSGMFKVINDPAVAQKLAISYPVEGSSFLQYSPTNEEYFPLSDVIRVTENQRYYLSFKINTTKMVAGNANDKAFVKIVKYGDKPGSDEFSITDGSDNGFYQFESGLDWSSVTVDFTPDASKVNLLLGGLGNGLGGYVYVDDIKITPVLKARQDDLPWNIDQSCRLYPKEDSLSCEYTDDAGLRLKGDYGYCLEYDRPPGNPETCLLWWPIDRVSGQGEGAKSASAEKEPFEHSPLFYCVAAPSGNSARPYLDASSMAFMVDEKWSMVVNGESVLSKAWIGWDGDHNDQRGVVSSYLKSDSSIVNGNKIYLKPGKNTINIDFRGSTGTGVCFFQLVGNFLWTEDGTDWQTGRFTLSGDESSGKNSPMVSIDYEEDMTRTFSCEIKESSLRDEMKNWEFMDQFGVDGKISENKLLWIVNKNETGDSGSGNDQCDLNKLPGNGTTRIVMTIDLPPKYPCTSVVQVVDRNGTNKVWAERVKASSLYEADCNSREGLPIWVVTSLGYDKAEGGNVIKSAMNGTCAYSADVEPYGAINPPGDDKSTMSSPVEWGGLNSNSPLFYQQNNPRMGQLYSQSSLSYLFAESYGAWKWNSSEKKYLLNDDSGLNWSSPTAWCLGNTRGAVQDCVVRPEIKNIKIDGKDKQPVTILGRGFVNLSFNSFVDVQQTPLKMYEIDWGDGEKLTVSGSDMKTLSSDSKPHSSYHAYDYWDLYGKFNQSSSKDTMPTLVCSGKDSTHPYDYCSLKLKIKIQDNWGWCTEGRDNTPCPTPSTAFCVNSNNVSSGSAKAYCRDYTTSQVKYVDRICSAAYPYCADGYYESANEVIIYNYTGF